MNLHGLRRESRNLTHCFVFCDGSEALPTAVPKSICEFNSEAVNGPSVPQHRSSRRKHFK